MIYPFFVVLKLRCSQEPTQPIEERKRSSVLNIELYGGEVAIDRIGLYTSNSRCCSIGIIPMNVPIAPKSMKRS